MTERNSAYSIRERHWPSLDGMRGVAILLVVISHLGVGAVSGTSSAEWVARLGAFGVKILFFLSGFLITTLGRMKVSPLDLILAPSSAWASYRFIERPCLCLLDRRWPAVRESAT